MCGSSPPAEAAAAGLHGRTLPSVPRLHGGVVLRAVTSPSAGSDKGSPAFRPP